MECFLTHELKVDKYATICFGTNHYSVPDMFCGRMVDVKVYSNELKVYYTHGLICSHDRNYGRSQWIITLDHYLKTLERKPGALHGSLALNQAPEPVREVYSRWFTNQARDFIELLQFCLQAQVDHQKLLEVAIYVSGICSGHVTADKIIALLGNQPSIHNDFPAEEVTGEIEAFSNLQLKEITFLMPFNMENVA